MRNFIFSSFLNLRQYSNWHDPYFKKYLSTIVSYDSATFDLSIPSLNYV